MMNIIGFMIVRNEIDVIGENLRYYAKMGIKTAVIDDGSDDGTLDVVRRHATWFRTRKSDVFDLTRVLDEGLRFAQEKGPDWLLHIDADHFYDLPAGFTSFERLVRAAEASNCNVIDFHEFTFHRTRFDDIDERSVQLRMRYYSKHNGLRQPWLFKVEGSVENSTHGGHRLAYVTGSERRFPASGLLRHYPLRLHDQAISKLADRRSRYSQDGLSKGWHRQYDSAGASGAFFDDVSELAFWDQDVEFGVSATQGSS